ncbi:MAG: DUF2207 domain-containing protein [Candidatus Nanopelagicales bacterium]
MTFRLGYPLAAVLTAAGLLWPVVPALLPSTSAQTSDPVVVTSYDATYSVADSGRLTAVENVTGAFPDGRHGIFRFWDVADPINPHVRYLPAISAITMDGLPVPYTTSWQSGHRYFVAKIGDPDHYVSAGSHLYRIAYTIDGVISPPATAGGRFVTTTGKDATTPGSVFLWRVVAQGWLMDMDKVRVVVALPGASQVVQCAVLTPTNGPCTISGTGTRTVTLGADRLPAASGMSTRMTMAGPAPAQVTVPWPVALDQVLGTSLPLATGVGVLALIGLLVGIGWARRTHESPPGFPVTYAPPAGLGPVQTVFIDDEQVGDHALTSTLLYQAEQGLVTLQTQSESTWLVIGKGTPEQWAATDPVTAQVGRILGVTTPGQSFLADGATGAGKVLTAARSSLAKSAGTWAGAAGLEVRVPSERVGKALWGLAVLLAIGGFIAWIGPTMLGLPFAAFVLGGVALSHPGVGTRRSEQGRRTWSEAGGFQRLLSTPSAEDRFDFAARKDLFVAYIPYAVAFGVADRWAKKYRTATGQEPPTPSWYPVGSGYTHGSYGTSFDSFDSALASSISAYSASQSSSSGGGGGGGGGGSW